MTKPLRYLIGADNVSDQPGKIVEAPYGVKPPAGGIWYCNLYDQRESYNAATNTGRYGPYLPPTDTAAEYGEGVVDPNGAGWLPHLEDQIKRAASGDAVEWDNCDGYPVEKVLQVYDMTFGRGFNVVAKNVKIIPGGQQLTAHPAVVGAVVEEDCGTPKQMHEMRLNAGKPDLPIWFVAYGSGEDWARKTADLAIGSSYKHMGVTYDWAKQEYGGEVEDFLVPITGETPVSSKRIVISSGHGKHVAGASGFIEEHPECVRVVDQTAAVLRTMGVDVVTFHDTVSTTQNENLNRIVDFHNSQTRDLDVSVHFNSAGTTQRPLGTECLYVTQLGLADDVAEAIAGSSGLIDRGPKKRTDLFFLNQTEEPAILIEVCFVDSKADVDIYHAKFNDICDAIAETISGEESVPVPPPNSPPDISVQRTLKKGDKGPDVVKVQRTLGIPDDGDFGPTTDGAVKGYQAACGVTADGIVGPTTWGLLDELDARMAAGKERLSQETIDAIVELAEESAIADYSWRDRGRSPEGYIPGMALCFADAMLRHSPAMMERDRNRPDTDALSWYAAEFRALGMDNSRDGVDTLRHLFALMIGLGMRESSGNHWCGVDQSASNHEPDTAEAGLFQTSWNIRSASSEIPPLLDEYWNNLHGYRPTFSEGVSPNGEDLKNYGDGNDGTRYQFLSKYAPAFHAMVTAVGMRTLRQHWGPINRKEAELKREADEMLQEIQLIVEAIPTG